jgi:hypothetical protein
MKAKLLITALLGVALLSVSMPAAAVGHGSASTPGTPSVPDVDVKNEPVVEVNERADSPYGTQLNIKVNLVGVRAPQISDGVVERLEEYEADNPDTDFRVLASEGQSSSSGQGDTVEAADEFVQRFVESLYCEDFGHAASPEGVCDQPTLDYVEDTLGPPLSDLFTAFQVTPGECSTVLIDLPYGPYDSSRTKVCR